MTVLSALRPRTLPAFDIPLSMVCGFGFAVGLLVSARMGLSDWKARHLYATGFSLQILGLMALALILSVFLLAFLGGDPHPSFDFLWKALGLLDDPLYVVLAFFVTPFALFVVGHTLCCVAARNKPGPPEQPRPAPPSSRPEAWRPS